MTTDFPATALTMVSRVTPDAKLETWLSALPLPAPGPDDVVVRMQAAPINPSDLGLMFGAADITTLRSGTRDDQPLVTADVTPAGMRAMAARVGQTLPVGNEGCGVVVATGTAPVAQALLGRTVALFGGASFADYRCLPAAMCMALPDGTLPRDGASCFVNPLTALSFVELMRAEGHSALVHTAAASNLGQMLVKICAADGVPLVNIVRSPAQEALLRDLGATHIVDSTADSFTDDLAAAVAHTAATCAFDAVGGGKLAGQILAAMELAAVAKLPAYSRYGSDVMKQIYIYGALDMAPTVINRSFGFTWSVGGFLLMNFLAKAGPATAAAMRARIVAELTTTFASHYSHEIGLAHALDPTVIAEYNAKRTGEKYLILL